MTAPTPAVTGAALVATFAEADVEGFVHAVDLETGREVEQGAMEPVVLASVFKIPVLLELFVQGANGRLDLTEPVAVPAEGRSPGPFGISVMRDPITMSLRDLAWLMMGISDNAATDVICDVIGIDAVNARLTELGLNDTVLVGLGSWGRCNAAAVDRGVAAMTKSGPAGAEPWVREVFWRARMSGAVVADAAAAAGIYERTGKKWVAQCGGVRPRPPAVPSGRFLSIEEREQIAIGLAQHKSMASIARELGRPTSTVTREAARNRDWRGRYRAVNAHRQAGERALRPKPAKLVVLPELREYVQDRLSKDQWSPEQIANTLPVAFPNEPEMRVSHETIYQSLYVQSRGALKRELTACLRTGRAIRRPKKVATARRNRIPDMVMISERPAEVADRALPGHWEGDLIIGAGGQSAIGTLVERTSRFCLLVHLPDNHGAEAVRDALRETILALPEQLRGSLTWDQGIEMARHAEITLATDLDIYFCDPHSPWQRGSNENTNGLLRQYFPKGTDLSVHSPEYLIEIAARLNDRPRKTLEWRSPRMVLNEHLVATAA